MEITDGITENGEITLADHTLTWHVTDVAPDTWYAITKTFTVLSGTWKSGLITESLWVAGAGAQLADRVLTFQQGTEARFFVYLSLILRNR